MNKFFVVMREKKEGGFVCDPTLQHPTQSEAVEEAIRLSEKEGCTFFVFESIGIVTQKPVWNPLNVSSETNPKEGKRKYTHHIKPQGDLK